MVNIANFAAPTNELFSNKLNSDTCIYLALKYSCNMNVSVLATHA